MLLICLHFKINFKLSLSRQLVPCRVLVAHCSCSMVCGFVFVSLRRGVPSHSVSEYLFYSLKNRSWRHHRRPWRNFLIRLSMIKKWTQRKRIRSWKWLVKSFLSSNKIKFFLFFISSFLPQFKESYPHIYAMRFPQPEMVTFKKRNKAILQLARLRSLRVWAASPSFYNVLL